eukprot:maker-scaffold63_size435493-snap-gene-2.15 protein:Tk00830 transcript:maker-scaffold63_size435493-snap-gene-2.15-mRNA-1 annotation:"mad protein"
MSIADLLQAAAFLERQEKEAEHGYAASPPPGVGVPIPNALADHDSYYGGLSSPGGFSSSEGFTSSGIGLARSAPTKSLLSSKGSPLSLNNPITRPRLNSNSSNSSTSSCSGGGGRSSSNRKPHQGS